MPVITRIMTDDNGSTRNARSMLKSSDAIHVNSVWSMARWSAGMPATCITRITATAKKASTAGEASQPDAAFGSRRPSEALTRNPSSGNRGISASISPLQRRKGVGVQRLASAEQRDHQRQADRRFGGGDGDDEEHDDLSVDVAGVAAECHERQVDRVQHDLDR